MELAFSHIAALYSLQKLAASNSFLLLQPLQIDHLIKETGSKLVAGADYDFCTQFNSQAAQRY